MFKLTIKTDNEAFSEDPGYEIARILKKIAQKLEDGDTNGPVMDVNGNKVGQWVLEGRSLSMSRANDLIKLAENVGTDLDEGAAWDAVKGAASKAAQFIKGNGTGKPKSQAGTDLYRGSARMEQDVRQLMSARAASFGNKFGGHPENMAKSIDPLTKISKYFPFQKEIQQLIQGLKKYGTDEYQKEGAWDEKHQWMQKADEVIKKMLTQLGTNIDREWHRTA